MEIEITNNDGYDWVENGEVYEVQEESKNGFYIEVFGASFHVLKEDARII